jgi:mono/diheme cytochrome c family protein
MLREDDALYRGKNADGSYVSQAPISKSDATLARGEERYGIYCVPCHGASGLGDGIVIKKGFPIPPPTFWDPRVMAMADGEIFNIISEGVRNMPSYKAQISIEDRWHIILYLRGLQSQPAPSKEAQE